jgi:hypothetical protein
MYTFPPTPPKPETTDDMDTSSDTNKFSMVADILPKRLPSIKSSNGAPHSDDNEQPLLSLESLQQQYSQYDGTRGDTFSPSLQGDLATKRLSRLPTTATLNADLRTLNLHLALRTKEIIACSESMWEWVEQFQRESAATSMPNLNALSNWSLDMTRCAILEMTREDFDLLLNNFTMQVPVLSNFLAVFPQIFSPPLIGTFKTRQLLVTLLKNDSIGTSCQRGGCRIE